MSFPSAQGSTNLTKMRGSAYDADQFMLLCSNTVVFAARVNGAPTGKTYAQLTFDTVTTGAYTDLEVGMTVYLSRTGDIKNTYFRGRVRKTPTSSILYVNENSESITDNDYIFVVRDWALHPKFARVVGSNYYKDFDKTYAHPAPIVTIIQSAYVGIADAGTDLFTQAFAANAIPVASGATVSNYLFAIPSGVSVVSGSLSTSNVTLSFPTRQEEYWVTLTVTDSNSVATVMHFPVWSIPADLSTTIAVGFDGATVEGGLDSGWNATVNAFEGVSDVLDQTLAVLFEVENYSGTTGSLVTDIKFVGRFRRDTNSNTSDEQASRLLSSSFEIEGIASQLSRMPMEKIKAVIKSSPTVWDEIKDLTPWRAVCHFLATHTTFFNVNSMIIQDTTNTYTYPSFPVNGQSVFDAIKDILFSVNSNIEWSSSGIGWLMKDLRYDTPSHRASGTVLIDFDIQDALSVNLEYQHVNPVAQINGAGGSYSTSNGQELVVFAKWPGITAGQGFSIEAFNRQIIDKDLSKTAAAVILRKLIGYHAAVLNNRFRLSVEFPDQYNWIIPTRGQWYRWILSVSDQDGLRHDFTTSKRWICESVTITHDNTTASKTIQATFSTEADAVDGQDYEPPASGSIVPVDSVIPVDNVYDNWPDLSVVIGDTPPANSGSSTTTVAPMDGSVQIAVTNGSESHGWVTREGLLPSPRYVPLDPPLATGEYITDAKLAALGLLDAYFLATDGTTSHVYYTDNVLKNAQDWVTSADITGEFTDIRTTAVDGSLLIKGNTATSDIEHWDLTTDTHGGSIPPAGGTATFGFGSFGGTGLASSSTPNGGGIYFAAASWAGLTNVTTLTLHFSSDVASHGVFDLVVNSSGGVIGSPSYQGSDGTGYVYQWTFTNENFTTFNLYSALAAQYYLDWVEWEYSLTPSYLVAYSSDHGATFATPIAAGAGRIDTEKVGNPSLIGATTQVKIATTLGGSYSNYGSAVPTGTQPTAIHIPHYEFGSTTVKNISTITPEFLMASNVLSGTNEALWKVTVGGNTFTSITPLSGGQYGIAISNDCITMPWRSGAIILALLDFGGTRKIARSLNSGSSWTFSSALDAAAQCLVTIVNDKANRQLWFANGSLGVGYIKNYQSSLTVVNKALPTSDPVTVVDVYL